MQTRKKERQKEIDPRQIALLLAAVAVEDHAVHPCSASCKQLKQVGDFWVPCARAETPVLAVDGHVHERGVTYVFFLGD